jgi:DNA-binding GntR family transcriptional regulator
MESGPPTDTIFALSDVLERSDPSSSAENSSDRAYIAIERRLVTGLIPPRSLINEAELCKMLSLGRTLVRVALQRLANHGLVEIVPRRGIFATSMDFQGQLLILEMRRELDPALFLAASRLAGEKERQVLHAISAEVRQASQERDAEAHMEIDLRFKRLLLNIAGNPILARAILPVHSLSRRFYFMNATEADPGVDDALANVITTIADGSNGLIRVASDQLIAELYRFARETILARLGIAVP